MTRLMTGVLLAAILIASPMAVMADEPTFEQDVRKLMEVTGAAAMGEQVVNQMLDGMSKNVTGESAEYLRRFRAELDPNEMVELNVPIYMKHFTHEEIKGLVEFYESPIGKKTIEKLPLVMQESMAAGQAWGEKLAQKILGDLQGLE